MKLDNFAVFILSHGRADNIKTLKALKKGNYTGKWYIVIDNEDKQAKEYYKRYGKENVIMFDKLKISKTFDVGDNFTERRTVMYAPSCVSIHLMGDKHKRIHRKVSWNNCAPKIISYRFKKE